MYWRPLSKQVTSLSIDCKADVRAEKAAQGRPVHITEGVRAVPGFCEIVNESMAKIAMFEDDWQKSKVTTSVTFPSGRTLTNSLLAAQTEIRQLTQKIAQLQKGAMDCSAQ